MAVSTYDAREVSLALIESRQFNSKFIDVVNTIRSAEPVCLSWMSHLGIHLKALYHSFHDQGNGDSTYETILQPEQLITMTDLQTNYLDAIDEEIVESAPL